MLKLRVVGQMLKMDHNMLKLGQKVMMLGQGLAENEPQIGDNESIDGNGLEDVDVGPGVVDVGQDAENGPEIVDNESSDDIGPELADDDTTDDNGAEDGLDGSEEDAFLFNIDIGSDVDEEVNDIRENGRGKRHKEKAEDREQATHRDGQPVQPYNVDKGYRSSEKDGKLEGYKIDYISSSDPGEYEASLRFDDNKQFKEAVRKYAFAKGVQLKIVKNEPNRTRFHYMKGCPWTLFASIDKKLRCYTVKTYNYVYMYYRTNKDKLISAKYIQKQFKDIILANPKMKVKTLKEMCKRELGVYASFNMCKRTRKQVIKEFRESYVEEYANLWGMLPSCSKAILGVLSNYIEEFDDSLQKLKKLGHTSTEDLLQILVQHWAKAYFSARPTCDVVDNNMAEAFNAWILDARCKPIISLSEDIKIMVMSRLHIKRTWTSKWRTNISPKALEKLEHNMEQSTHCRLVWNGDGGAWELSGIPCCHAICAMYQENKRPEDYVSNWYNKEKYLAAYNHVLQPNVASSITSPPGMVHGTLQNVASPTTQNVASATTGPPGMVHGTSHNVASATTNPPGMVHSTTQNVASTISQSSNQNLASFSTVAPTTQPKPIKKTYKKKAQVGIDLYTNLKTGQIWNPGTSTERVVTRASKMKIGEADPSQFQHHPKGPRQRTWHAKLDETSSQLRALTGRDRYDQRDQTNGRGYLGVI
ncbi:hypothetical protein V6N13_053635 [Hibiscus sabdariffa]